MNYICKCNKDNFFNKRYSYWEEREVTTDELEVINFILNSNDVKFNSILHIGIGNSYFCKIFNQNSKITGITISEKEIDKAKSMNLSNYNFFLFDKYSIEFNSFVKDKKFDLIVDTNLKSYSCCHETFLFYIKSLFKTLNNNGILITSINGMGWVKNLKPKLTFSFKKLFHFKLKEINGNENNILTKKELKLLSDKYNLDLFFNDKICYLKK